MTAIRPSARRSLTFFLAASFVALLAGSADANRAATDCYQGCQKCQDACKGDITCIKMCVPQWAGCCVTQGKKPMPGMASCGCQ